MPRRPLWLSLFRALALGAIVCLTVIFSVPLVAMVIARARTEGR